MKDTITLEDASHSYDSMICELRQHFTELDRKDSDKIKLANEYYKWTSLKTKLIINEKNF